MKREQVKPRARHHRRSKWNYKPEWECVGTKDHKLVTGYGATLEEAYRNWSKR